MSALITSAVIAEETLTQFENSLIIANKADWKYNKEFGKSANPIGATYNLRKPISMISTEDNIAWTTANANVNEVTVQMVIDRTLTQPMAFSEADFALRGAKAVKQFMDRYVSKVARLMANKLDAAVHQSIVNSKPGNGINAGSGLIQTGLAVSAGPSAATPNFAGYVVGDYGVSLTQATITLAGQILEEMGCPDDGQWFGVLTPSARAQLLTTSASLFNSMIKIDDQYRNGFIGEFANFKFASSATCARHTNGTLAALAVTTGSASSGWAESATLTVTSTAGINLGDVFQAPAQYMVNPGTFAATSLKAQFQVLKVVDGTHVTVAPAPIFGGQYPNISATIDGVTLALVGTAGASGQESILFHKEAIAMASPELYLPKKAVEMAELIKNEDIDGFAIRLIRDWDTLGVSGAFGGGVGTGGSGSVTKFDCFWTCKTVQPWIIRVRN